MLGDIAKGTRLKKAVTNDEAKVMVTSLNCGRLDKLYLYGMDEVPHNAMEHSRGLEHSSTLFKLMDLRIQELPESIKLPTKEHHACTRSTSDHACIA